MDDRTVAGDAVPSFLPNASEARSNDFGDYELLGEIASGGMGIVYRARQRSLNRVIALKMIRSERLASAESIRRFNLEARAAARLQHPHIVAIHEIGEHDSQHFYAMDYVAGRNLAHLVRENPLPAKRAAAYVAKVARAIHFAHQNGVLHRDLKPENILIDSAEEPRITDFGLAKVTEGESFQTLSGTVMGTPSYMSPEQAAGDSAKLGPESDVYSLGAILYELLTGRPPFRAESPMATLRLVLETDPVLPRRLNPRIPIDLETISLKCLEKNPARRYPSALALADDLDRFLESKPIAARQIGAFGKTVRWCARKPALAASAAVIGALLLAVAIGSPIAAYRINRARNEAEENGRRARSLADSLRHRVYQLQLRAATAALDQNDGAKAREQLEACEPNLRGWEWNRLRHLTDRSLEKWLLSTNPIASIAFDPARRELFAASAEGFRIVARDTGQEVWRVAFPSSVEFAAGAFSRDASRLAVIAGKTITVWNRATRAKIAEHTIAEGRPRALRFTPDGNRLLIGIHAGSLAALLWEPASDKIAWSVPGRAVFHLCLSQDATHLAADEWDGPIHVWSVEEPPRHIVLEKDSEWVSELALSPDNQQLAVSGFTGSIRIFDLRTGAKAREFPSGLGRMTAFEYAPDGQTLAALGVTAMKLYETARFTEQNTFLDESGNASCLAIDPAGEGLATGNANGAVKLWSSSLQSSDRVLRAHTGQLREIDFNPAGTQLISAGFDGLKLWNLETRASRHLDGYRGAIYAAAFSPDRRFIAAGGEDRSIHFWDSTSGVHLREMTGHDNAIWWLAFSPDSSLLLSAGPDKTARLWDVPSGKELRRLPIPTGSVNGAAFSPDGTLIATCEQDEELPPSGLIRIWKTSTGEPVRALEGFKANYRCVAFHPKNNIVAAAVEAPNARLWNLNTGTNLTLRGSYGRLESVAFTPDGTRVFGGGDAGWITVWDSETGQELLTFPAGQGTLWCLKPSPDGTTLASSGQTGEIRLWQTLTAR